MSLAEDQGFGLRICRLGLPHLGGLNVLLVGPESDRLASFAAFQRASEAMATPTIDPCDLATGSFDIVVWLDGSSECLLAEGRLARVMSLLTRQGLLVLESTLATAPALPLDADPTPASAILTREALDAGLAGYAIKQVGAPHEHPFLEQGFSLVVHHVAIRRPVVCLMMAPPGWGKSSLARQIFGGDASSLPVIAADSLIHRIARDQVAVDDALREAIQQDFSPLQIDQAVFRIMARGQVEAWVDAVVEAAGEQDFVLEGFVPSDSQGELQDAFRERGFLPVRMDWDRQHPAPMDVERAEGELRRFEQALAAGAGPASLAAMTPGTVAGNVDAMIVGPKGVTLRGWAVTATGHRPSRFEVRHGREVLEVIRAEVEDRPDVRDHLDLPHGRIGFRLLVGPGSRKLRRLSAVSVRVADEHGEWHGPLHRSG